jgi:hypothetical protein
MPVPIKDAGRSLGEITVRIEPDDTLLVGKRDLGERLAGVMTPAATAGLAAMPDAGGFVTLAALEATGIALRFDPGLLELQVQPKVEQRPTGDIAIGTWSGRSSPAVATARPAIWSGWVNVTGGVDHQWAVGGAADRTGLRLDTESVFRL